MANEKKTHLPAGIDASGNCEKSLLPPTTLKNPRSLPDRDISKESTTLEVQKNMPAPGPAPLASVLLPGEHKDIRIDVRELLDNADSWLATPNFNLRGRRPLDLIGTPDEQLLRDTLRSALYSGMA